MRSFLGRILFKQLTKNGSSRVKGERSKGKDFRSEVKAEREKGKEFSSKVKDQR